MSEYRKLEKYTKDDIKNYTSSINKLHYLPGSKIYPKEKFKQVYFRDVYCPYIISSYGRIFSVDYHSVKGLVKELHPRSDKDGYSVICINFGGVTKTAKMHRLVASAFIDNPENKPQVNHRDGDKSNNHVWNLEWVTNSENINHAIETGLINPIYHSGELMWNSIYTSDQIIQVCELLMQNKSFDEISKITGVKRYTISDILAHRKWNNVTYGFDFSGYMYGKDVDKIKRVCELLQSNEFTQAEISRMTGVPIKKVFAILTGAHDREISRYYDFSKFDKTTSKNVKRK